MIFSIERRREQNLIFQKKRGKTLLAPTHFLQLENHFMAGHLSAFSALFSFALVASSPGIISQSDFALDS